MEFHGSVNQFEDDIWTDDVSVWPENDNFSNYKFNDQSGFKTGRSYVTDHSQNPRSCFFSGRHNGPAGRLNQKNFERTRKEKEIESFLLQCGVVKSVLKGLPRALLHLMKSEHCGVCGHELINLDTARLHYSSKNHTKNVKKWVSQQAKVGSKRPLEIPFKPRESYCELCDIHITSTVHAESHYGGKQHRAIVYKRKMPKNPYLLQQNMQNRVEQLIRRELRSLTRLTVNQAPSEVAKTEPTSVTPELYCAICKSQVTSSDQMTMHLNGKKHLAKEKQHILNMMKGEATITTPKPAESVEPVVPVESADTSATDKGKPAEPADTSATDNDIDDWGPGSSTWDDDPQ